MGSAGGWPSAWKAAQSTGGVERPPRRARRAGAASPPRRQRERVADRAAEQRGGRAQAADRGHGRCAAAAEREPGRDGGGRGERGGTGDEGVARVPAEAHGDGRARERDPGEEDAVEEREEGEQDVAAAAGAETRCWAMAQSVIAAPPAPAVGSSRVAAAPPNVISRAGAQAQARGRPVADEPEERDVAAEGEELGDRGDRDPAWGRPMSRGRRRRRSTPSGPPATTMHRHGRRRRARRGAPPRRATRRRSRVGRVNSGAVSEGERTRSEYQAARTPLYIRDVPSHDPTVCRTPLRGSGSRGGVAVRRPNRRRRDRMTRAASPVGQADRIAREQPRLALAHELPVLGELAQGRRDGRPAGADQLGDQAVRAAGA